MHRLANEVPVVGFRTTLFWPLILDSECEPDKRPDIVRQQLSCLSRRGAWKPVDDLIDHVPKPPGSDEAHLASSYSELTYFHEFVQNFLFARPDEKDRKGPLQLFRRTDITHVDVVFATGHRTIHYPMEVERLNLYVIDSLGVALLAMELSAFAPDGGRATIRKGDASKADRAAQGDFDGLIDTPISLADVQRFNDGFRRAHAPFLFNDLTPPVSLGHVPRAVRWRSSGPPFDLLSSNPAKKTSSESEAVARGLRTGNGPRAIPPFRHFAHLLEGWNICPRGARGESWRHLADDRLPVLSCIELPNAAVYGSISFGDWARLCFVDPPGNDAVPYATAFLEQDWSRHVYDRFNYAAGESTSPPSRYLVSGYSLLAVGAGWFFANHVRQHMRRHYFQLMLLAQIERAALLAVSGDISRAVRRREAQDGEPIEKLERFEARLQAAEQDFLRFIHRFRFTGVSDQMQPTELFAMLRRNMRLAELYADLKDELTTATEFLALLNQQRQTASTVRLSVVATFGVIIGLAFALLGANILNAEDVQKLLGLFALPEPRFPGAAALGILAVTVGGCFLLGLGMAHLAMPRSRDSTAEDQLGTRLRRLLGTIGMIGLLLGFALLAIAVLTPFVAGSLLVVLIMITRSLLARHSKTGG